jgi:flagellar basal-body rod protein FlgB
MGDGFKTLEGFLRLTVLRHGIISSNIANVDTPGYRAKDVHFGQLLEKETMELKVTNPYHIRRVRIEEDGTIVVEDTSTWKDGNNVELDVEMAKMAENALLFQAGITLLSSKIRMFKNALRR